jgi:4'-phosphopantetheinyl transferase EntD
VEHLLEGLLPTEILTSATTIEDCLGDLMPEERTAIAKAVESRQSEFATGRVITRRLLSALGHPDFPLLRDDDRVPRWPEDVVGSISHSRGIERSLCVAAVGRASDFFGIGIDCEPDEPVHRDVERVVCRGDEHAWVADGVGEDERGRRCRIVFSVKEAVYKAFYPRTRVYWSFQDVLVSIDLGAGRYSAELPASAGRPVVEGRIFRREGWILSASVVE